MNARSQVACAWAGLVGVVLILVALLIAGYIPPPRADAAPAEIAGFYRGHAFMIRLGLLIAMLATAGWAALVAVVWVQLSPHSLTPPGVHTSVVTKRRRCQQPQGVLP
jgi:hypothetical protein